MNKRYVFASVCLDHNNKGQYEKGQIYFGLTNSKEYVFEFDFSSGS